MTPTPEAMAMFMVIGRVFPLLSQQELTQLLQSPPFIIMLFLDPNSVLIYFLPYLYTCQGFVYWMQS